MFLGEETQLFRNELCNFVFQTWKILLSIAQNFEMWAPYASSSSSSSCIFLNKFMLPFFVSLTISLEEPKHAVNFCRIYISLWESTVVGFLLCNWNQWMTDIWGKFDRIIEHKKCRSSSREVSFLVFSWAATWFLKFRKLAKSAPVLLLCKDRKAVSKRMGGKSPQVLFHFD